MNKELEKAKIVVRKLKNVNERNELGKSIETVLQALENSIPKEVILDKIRERQFELQQEYLDFKDDIELNTLQDLLEGK